MYKPNREKLRAARERLKRRDPVRGTPEERARHQIEVFYDMKPFRDEVDAHLDAHSNVISERRIARQKPRRDDDEA
jgi:hypothetical protein